MESDLDHSDYCPTQNDHKTSRAKVLCFSSSFNYVFTSFSWEVLILELFSLQSSRPNRLFKSNSTSGSGMQNSHTDETYEPIMGEGRQNNRRSRYV